MEEVRHPEVDPAVLLEGRRGFQALLQQEDFRSIWIAQVLAQLGDKFLMFSLMILAYQVSRANTQVAFTLLSYTLPALVVGPFAGVLVDRYDKKRIMLWTNLVRGVIVAFIPLQALTPLAHQTWPILIDTAVFAAVGQLFAPAEAAAIPKVVTRESLVTASSMFLVTMVLTLVIGAPVAQVVSRANVYAPYWIATGLFFVAGFFIARIRRSLRVHVATPIGLRQVLSEIADGWRAVRGDRQITFVFGQLTLSILVLFTMSTLGPGYMSSVLHLLPSDAYAILLPAMVGIFAGAFVLGQFGHRWQRARIAGWALAGAGIALAIMGLVPGLINASGRGGLLYWFAVSLSLLFGFDFGLLLIPSITLLMENADEQLRGRIFGLLNTVINGVTAVPVLIAGGLADIYGVSQVVLVLGAVLFAGGLGSRLAARFGYLGTAPG